MPSPESIRIITVIAFFLLLGLGIKRTVYAVAAYFVLVYCKLSEYYTFFALIKSELIFAIIIIGLILIKGGKILKIGASYNSVNKYLYFFISCMFVSFMFAWDKQLSWDYSIYHFIKVLIFYAMIILAVDSENDIKILVLSILIVFSWLAYEPVFGFLNQAGGSRQVYGTNYIAREGILSGHVALANNMNQMIPIAYYLLMANQDKKEKILYLGCLAIFIIALIGSGSRGGMLGFGAFSMLIFYNSKRKFLLGFIILTILFAMLVSSSSIQSTVSRIDSNSAYGRLTGLTHGIEMVKRGNIFGVGPGNFRVARGYYFSYTMDSHNIYGEALGELGIFGSLVWFLLIKEIFKNLSSSKAALRKINQNNGFLYYSILGLQVSLIVRLFISTASHGLYYFYWYLVAAISICLKRETDKRITLANGEFKSEL